MTSNTCTMWYLQVFYYVYIIELYDPSSILDEICDGLIIECTESLFYFIELSW